MKVFISWSGGLSEAVAQAIREWLPAVVQSADVWLSSKDLRSGTQWANEIGRELEETNFGIICLTRQNTSSEWMLFESGALAKSIKIARVVPLCIDLRPAEVTGPLLTFHGRELTEESIFEIVDDINKLSEKPLVQDTLQKTFNAMWPSLSSDLERIRGRSFDPEGHGTHRPVPEMIEEIVNRIRVIEKKVDEWNPHSRRDNPPPPVMPAFTNFSQPVQSEIE